MSASRGEEGVNGGGVTGNVGAEHDSRLKIQLMRTTGDPGGSAFHPGRVRRSWSSSCEAKTRRSRDRPGEFWVDEIRRNWPRFRGARRLSRGARMGATTSEEAPFGQEEPVIVFSYIGEGLETEALNALCSEC